MRAAAHTVGGFGDVSQKVGKEFVGKDSLDLRGLVKSFVRWALSDDDAKLTKAEVDYSPSTGDDRCDGCVHFENGACEIVKGEIDPAYWCQRFERASSLAQDAALIAFDKGTERSYDQDGRLHVGQSNISKACVNEYLGREIPGADVLGLDPDRKYKLLRDPDELAKAAPTFNNLPLLSRHIPITADTHDPSLVIGSTGSTAEFDAPYLKNGLVIWPREAIDAVESGQMKQLSCAYRYVCDLTPGVYEGQPYDGVMRSIVGNHVAVVKEGRAGSDVVVGDSALSKTEDVNMALIDPALSRRAALAKWVLMTHLTPKLAKDAKLDLVPILKGIDEKNWATRKADLLKEVQTAVKPLLIAQDQATPDDVMMGLINMIDGGGTPDPAAPVDPTAPPVKPGDAPLDPTKPADPVDPTKKPDDPAAPGVPDVAEVQALVAKAPPEVLAKIAALLKGGNGAADEPPPFKGKPEVGKGPPAQDGDKDMITKPAMDAAIKEASDKARTEAVAEVTRNARETRDAERKVRPWVGDLAIACDSAESVYRTTLKTLGVKNADTMHKDALEAVLDAIPVPGSKPPRPALAHDAAASKSFGERFPGASHIRLA
jgi:uncharacterized protein